MVDKIKSPLGEMLIKEKIITREALDAGLAEQRKNGGFLGAALVKLGLAAEDKVYAVVSRKIGVPYVKLQDMEIKPSVIKAAPAKFACHYKFLPLKLEDSALTIAMSNPLDIHTIDDLKLLLGLGINPVLAGERGILEGIKQYYGVGAGTIESIIAEGPPIERLDINQVTTERLEGLAEDASIIKFVNQILLEAVDDRATDIHIEPYENAIRVRYRIDGVLYDTNIPPTIKHFHSAIVSRIKIMANLDIAERRLPQDGRIKVRVGENELDLRVSILPTPYGESVDIRLLSNRLLFSLEELGLSKQDLQILEAMIKRPHGIIFVTGPTGSGKTTTLYACLSKLNQTQRKIITIEDPIEYLLKGITQIQVLPKIGLTFAHGLRSMLRHDPDIMMVGEVRDMETAGITIRVALTGHLVFSTLHTNDAAGAVTRLLDMGIEPYLVSSSVECVIAQRLVRLICPECKSKVKGKKELIEKLNIKDDIGGIDIFEGKGCEACKWTGYRGRTAIYEMLVINDTVRDLILERTSASQIKKKAVALGMRTLREDGWEKVKKGLTTVSEVIRVTQIEGIV